MAPKVIVPMNFGKRLIASPTHNNLKLNTSDGGEMRASSVILSFNSPVIDHMTTTLHMTSVDMLEFSEAAVQLFVDAAYSGTAEGITRELFRDISKMANVFEMTWLGDKCSDYFTAVANSVKTPSYQDLLYIFEEAAFMFENLKIKNYLSLAIERIEVLEYKQEFINRYLENADRLSSQKLDMVIELAGTEVHCVVQTLTNQLTEVLKVRGSLLPVHCEYLLDNLDLSLCCTSNVTMFYQLFEVLKRFPDEKMRWVVELMLKSSKKCVPVDSLAAPVSDSCTPVVSRCNVIPNLYHHIDFNLTFDALLEWISISQDVTSLLMALEAVSSWNNYRSHNCKSWSCTVDNSVLSTKLGDLIKRRSWSLLPGEFINCPFRLYHPSFCPSSLNLVPFCSSRQEDSSHYVIIDCVETCENPLTVLSKDAKLAFLFKHPSTAKCHLPGECGFILKTVPSEAALWKLVLCTESDDYLNESVHFHEEIQAEKMHVFFHRIIYKNSYLFPLSWQFWLSTMNDKNVRKSWEGNFSFSHGSRFKVLYSL